MQTTTVRLEEEILEEIDKISKSMDRPRSWVIKEALKQFLEYNKQYEAALVVALDDVKHGRTVSHDDIRSSLSGIGINVD